MIFIALIPVVVIAPRNAQNAPIRYSLVPLRKSRKKGDAMDSIIPVILATTKIDRFVIHYYTAYDFGFNQAALTCIIPLLEEYRRS